jgi:sulfur-oxidizing protein SoxY
MRKIVSYDPGSHAGFSRRETLGLVLMGALAATRPPGALAQSPGRPAAVETAHRPQIDVPILADDPVAVPLTVSVDHPMEADHYIKALEVVLRTDPVPRKGVFHFTPRSGRASVAYQMRSGQGGELTVVAECTRHGRFEARHLVRVAPGGCALPPGSVTREQGGSPSVRTQARVRPGEVVAVWASLKHTSHTGLAEKNGTFVQERPAFFVERMTAFLGEERVSEFALTPAMSPDPKLRFFVKARPGTMLRVVFVDNRGGQWAAHQQFP